MELNTEYWTSGVQTAWSKYFYFAGSSLDNLPSWYDFATKGPIKLNQPIDKSICYGFSYRSKICQCALVRESGDDKNPIVVRSDVPFADYTIQRRYTFTPSTSALRHLQHRIGNGVNELTEYSTQGIYVRYALSKMRYLCKVHLMEFTKNSEDNYIRNDLGLMTLTDFKNSNYYTRYINHDNVYVIALVWEEYFENDNGVGRTIGNSTKPLGIYTIPALPDDFNTYTGNNSIYMPSNSLLEAEGCFVMGGQGEGRYSSDSSDISSSIFLNTSDKWNFLVAYNSGTSYRSIYAYLPPENLMSAFHEFAYFGLYYTGTQSVAESLALNLDDLYLGTMSNITGATDGDYIAFSSEDTPEQAAGKSAMANEATTFDSDPMADPNPNYTGRITPEDEDPNTYVTETPLSTPTLSPIDVFNRTYAMTAVQIRALADFLWNADDDKMTEILKGLELYGENPLNGLIDCRLYPFDLSGISEAGQQIIVGRVNTEVYGRKILNTANVVFDLGTCKFMKYFNNFLDYAPYTTGRLFLPYCGMVPIDTAEFMGKEISCKLIVDLITGACCCCIFLDEILTITANGVCGVEISMTGTDSATYASSVVNQFVNSTVQAVGAVAGAAAGAGLADTGAMMVSKAINTTGMSNTRLAEYNKGMSMETQGQIAAGAGGMGAVKALQGFWNLQHTPTQYAQRGSSTPSCETWLPQYPFFIVDSPITNIPSGYGHNVGFACIETGTLNSFSGFTICSNVDTSGFAQATEAERNELKMLLEAGVFL